MRIFGPVCSTKRAAFSRLLGLKICPNSFEATWRPCHLKVFIGGHYVGYGRGFEHSSFSLCANVLTFDLGH